MVPDDATQSRLASFVRDASGAKSASVTRFERMSGGAVQENWALDADLVGGPLEGAHRWVLRLDAPATVIESLTRAEEFKVLQAMHEADVLAPRPFWSCEDDSVIGRRFFIMERLPGVAAGHKVARDPTLVPDRKRLAAQLAENLARIHAVKPPHPALGFLRTTLARDNIARHRRYLDSLDERYPVLEWGLRWCETRAPEREAVTFVHGDYRTGNYLVDQGRLAGILDWEFAAWGNPLQDVGWIFAKCWRMGQHHYVVGGVADPEDFLPVYESAAGRRIEPAALIYWQVMAHLRWAMIALQQRERHRSGVELSLELALTGHIVSDLELEILELTEGKTS
jgi:aminoglycoside phosphotransferase (APT) family kinase protein